MKPSEYRFAKKKEICYLTGLSGDTLKEYRLSGTLSEDIHWIRINAKLVLYNVPLILDWVQNYNNPLAHQLAIESYMTGLPSNRKG
jgi:hypothetical protein